MLDNTESSEITYKGEKIPIKVLQGQDFVLAMTTSMPNCSKISKVRLGMDKEQIKSNMLNRPLNLNNRCTSILSNTMLAHAMSAIQNEELKYAYVPEEISQVSIQGKHDLSTNKKKDVYGNEQRVTHRSIQNRTAKDLVNSTTEEHNETVLNNVYPRYILCFDKISKVAIQKYQMLKKQYLEEGIDKNIEILLVAGQDKYLPKIETSLDENLTFINKEIEETGTISKKTIDEFFNIRENNITLQTVQAINSTSYRDHLWNTEKNSIKLNKLTDMLEIAAKVVPLEYIHEISAQVNFLFERKDRYSLHGNRFYDHCYSNSIDVKRLESIKEILNERLKCTPNSLAKEKDASHKEQEKRDIVI